MQLLMCNVLMLMLGCSCGVAKVAMLVLGCCYAVINV